ncbi:response regulator [Reinekea sp.]|jgi:DNA-binding NarL/FixJ family response regulator|uniref:response regulator n=1 Tax=Reinekea sp. TaxID=1970455 RepID=UPI00398A23A7
MRRLKIVLVEDSVLLQEMVTEVIESMPKTELVGVAATEEAALSTIAKNHPDLVVVDLQLKEGDGLGVLRALYSQSKKYGDPKKVVFTNNTSKGLKSRCEALGIEGYFDKSYQLDDLTDYVSSLSASS